jgi:NAD(P)H-hydrate repair Nnr-like enzyme with NAD(P)H-hydrate dehydratase domain
MRCPLSLSLVASSVLEEMMEVISERRALHRKHLHILLQEQILNLNLSFGMGDAYHGFEFMKERCKVTNANPVLDNDKVFSNNNFNLTN